MDKISKRLKLVELKTNREYWKDKESEACCDISNTHPHQSDLRYGANVRKNECRVMIVEISKLIEELEK